MASLPALRQARDGRTLVLRPVAPTDVERTSAFIRRLSFGTRYFRFGRSDVRLTAMEAACDCNPDPDTCWNFVIVTAEGDAETQVASAGCHVAPGGERGELTLLVADAWQGKGLADWLLATLIDVARHRGLKQVSVQVLATNARMLRLARKHRFTPAEAAMPAAIQTMVRTLEVPDSGVRATRPG